MIILAKCDILFVCCELIKSLGVCVCVSICVCVLSSQRDKGQDEGDYAEDHNMLVRMYVCLV